MTLSTRENPSKATRFLVRRQNKIQDVDDNPFCSHLLQEGEIAGFSGGNFPGISGTGLDGISCGVTPGLGSVKGCGIGSGLAGFSDGSTFIVCAIFTGYFIAEKIKKFSGSNFCFYF